MAQAPAKGGSKPIPAYNAADAMYQNTVPFFPRQRYLDKGLAPEKFPVESVKAAARATRTAVDAGILTPAMAAMVLPNILTENRPDDYGVTNARWTGGSQGTIAKIMKAIGMDKKTIVDKDVELPPEVAAYLKQSGKASGDTSGMAFKKGDVVIQPKSGDTPDELYHNAQLMTAVLAQKASISKTPEEAIRRWNGAGSGAENHLSKVMETSQLLSDPKNSEILELFKQEFMKEPQKSDDNKGKM